MLSLVCWYFYIKHVILHLPEIVAVGEVIYDTSSCQYYCIINFDKAKQYHTSLLMWSVLYYTSQIELDNI